jgi:hypothetical protein
MVEKKFVNLTPHEIVVYDQTGQNIILRIPPSGTVCRVSTISKVVGEINGIPVRKTVYGEIENLPPPQPDAIYITSTLVLIALKDKGIRRDDVIATDTTSDSVIRDKDGKIIGIKYFQVL